MLPIVRDRARDDAERPARSHHRPIGHSVQCADRQLRWIAGICGPVHIYQFDIRAPRRMPDMTRQKHKKADDNSTKRIVRPRPQSPSLPRPAGVCHGQLPEWRK
jgi:hypothetical protein